MAEQLIELGKIYENIYQPRMTDDPAHIEKLARSIAADGLMQAPKARKIDADRVDGYELAFGHSRLKAFEWLQSNFVEQGLPGRYEAYTCMPLDIVELTDEDMYRWAVSENIQRKDLNAIEIAKSMKQYRTDFNKTSDEVGQLFNMNGATVRGLIRLLDLPESVQQKVEAGEITQGAARKLLTVPFEAKLVKELADDIAQGEDPDDVIERSLRNQENTVTMWESWRKDEKQRGGANLWFLDMAPDKFPSKHMPELKAADIAKACDLEFTAEVRESIEYYMDRLTTKTDGSQAVVSLLMDTFPHHSQMIERIAHFLTMPACTGCPFHAVVDRSHYCTLKPCHQRKSKAWTANEVQKASKKLSIPIYDSKVDGSAYIPLCEHTYMDEHKRHDKLVKAKDSCLRVGPHKSEYGTHTWTDSHFARLILVGEKAKAIKEEKQVSRSQEQQKEEAEKRQRELERAFNEAARKFCGEYAMDRFAPAFEGMDNIAAMCALAGVNMPKKSAKKADVLLDLRERLADKALRNVDDFNWRLMEKGPVAVAKFLQNVATTWGVKLPADFMDVATKYEPAVATETPKKGKKK